MSQKKSTGPTRFNHDSLFLQKLLKEFPDCLKEIIRFVITTKNDYSAAVLVCHDWRNIIYQLVEMEIQNSSKYK